jgi:endonuclease/exonuclease/phosphatase family metal-dependent hydrolase
MSYNIRNVEGGDSFFNDPLTFEYNGRQNEVVNYILSESPDVIGIQEATIKKHAYNGETLSWFTYLDSATTGLLGNGYACYRGLDDVGTSKKQNYNPIYYKTAKYDRIADGSQFITDNGSQKVAVTYVVLRDKATGINFVYVNTHLIRKSDGNQAAMAINFKNYLLGLQQQYPSYPIFICGDFNGSYTDYKDHDAFFGDTAVNARTEATSKISMCSTTNKDFTNIGTSTGPIDLYYALNSTSIVVFHNFAVTDNKLTSGSNSGKYPSDHLPVKLIVSIYG